MCQSKLPSPHLCSKSPAVQQLIDAAARLAALLEEGDCGGASGGGSCTTGGSGSSAGAVLRLARVTLQLWQEGGDLQVRSHSPASVLYFKTGLSLKSGKFPITRNRANTMSISL
jgi:hypothetical protein